jgi:hypothetical protein
MAAQNLLGVVAFMSLALLGCSAVSEGSISRSVTDLSGKGDAVAPGTVEIFVEPGQPTEVEIEACRIKRILEESRVRLGSSESDDGK